MMKAHDFQMYYMQTVKHHKLKQQFYLITNHTFTYRHIHHRANVIGLHTVYEYVVFYFVLINTS